MDDRDLDYGLELTKQLDELQDEEPHGGREDDDGAKGGGHKDCSALAGLEDDF